MVENESGGLRGERATNQQRRQVLKWLLPGDCHRQITPGIVEFGPVDAVSPPNSGWVRRLSQNTKECSSPADQRPTMTASGAEWRVWKRCRGWRLWRGGGRVRGCDVVSLLWSGSIAPIPRHTPPSPVLRFPLSIPAGRDRAIQSLSSPVLLPAEVIAPCCSIPENTRVQSDSTGVRAALFPCCATALGPLVHHDVSTRQNLGSERTSF
jgi:hypothetical protein